MKKTIAILLAISVVLGGTSFAVFKNIEQPSKSSSGLTDKANTIEIKSEETTQANQGADEIEESTTKLNVEETLETTTNQSDDEQFVEDNTVPTTNSSNPSAPSVPSTTKPSNPKPSTPTTQPSAPNYEYDYGYEKWTKPLEVYEHDNVEVSKNWDKYAYISVYTTEYSKAKETQLKNEFKKAFGFMPTGTIEWDYMGVYMVDGYDQPQVIYQCCIYDCTYPLLEDEFYNVKKQICADGSPWVGFCVRGDEVSSAKASKLRDEAEKMFYNWTGYDYNYIYGNKNFAVHNVIWSTARTKDNQLIEIAYIFIRGYNVTTDINGNPIKL